VVIRDGNRLIRLEIEVMLPIFQHEHARWVVFYAPPTTIGSAGMAVTFIVISRTNTKPFFEAKKVVLGNYVVKLVYCARCLTYMRFAILSLYAQLIFAKSIAATSVDVVIRQRYKKYYLGRPKE